MYCGYQNHQTGSGMGFKHIEFRHQRDWQDTDPGQNWRYSADTAIEETLKNPLKTHYDTKTGNFVYCTPLFERKYGRNGVPTGKFKWSNVVIASDSGDIITAYPSEVPACPV